MDMSAISVATSNSMCLVLELCLVTPFTLRLRLSDCGLSISSAVTITGPKGA
ncbi:hypothetical protein D3C76_1567390 [compost metagenome]